MGSSQEERNNVIGVKKGIQHHFNAHSLKEEDFNEIKWNINIWNSLL